MEEIENSEPFINFVQILIGGIIDEKKSFFKMKLILQRKKNIKQGFIGKKEWFLKVYRKMVFCGTLTL